MALLIRRLWIGLFLAASFCWAQDPPTDVYKIGGDVTAPSVLHKVEPKYSEEGRLAQFEGAVVLFLVVGTDGKPYDLKVIRPLGRGLDENAISAVKQWEFRPGEKGGQPVNVKATIEVNFRLLKPKGSTRLGRVDFHIPPGASKPTIEKGELPVSQESERATLTARLDVDERGNAVSIHIEDASDEVWASEVTAALRQWKFKPGSTNGVPVSIPCTMNFIRGPVF